MPDHGTSPGLARPPHRVRGEGKGRQDEVIARWGNDPRAELTSPASRFCGSADTSYGHLLSGAGSACRTQPFAMTARSDRKSTRLNSSHLVISYAVFCL